MNSKAPGSKTERRFKLGQLLRKLLPSAVYLIAFLWFAALGTNVSRGLVEGHEATFARLFRLAMIDRLFRDVQQNLLEGIIAGCLALVLGKFIAPIRKTWIALVRGMFAGLAFGYLLGALAWIAFRLEKLGWEVVSDWLLSLDTSGMIALAWIPAVGLEIALAYLWTRRSGDARRKNG